jgi:arylsulfatase A-like enzyme
VHIPGFILHPRRLGLPRRISQLGSQVDLRATIADIVGMTDTQPGDGASLLRADPHRTIAHFTENGVSHFGVRDGRYSYIYTPQLDAEQLFDCRHDRGETRNLSARFPATVARYRARLHGWETQHQLSLARVLR